MIDNRTIETGNPAPIILQVITNGNQTISSPIHAASDEWVIHRLIHDEGIARLHGAAEYHPYRQALPTEVENIVVLTREQLQRLCFPDHSGGRSTRKRLLKLQSSGYVQKHRVPVAFPGTTNAAPVYYLTKAGTEILASWTDDETCLAVNTRQPRADRLNHWIAIHETRMVIEQSVARQKEVTLDRWINEWETVDKEAAEPQQFCLRTQLSTDPPLSCKHPQNS